MGAGARARHRHPSLITKCSHASVARGRRGSCRSDDCGTASSPRRASPGLATGPHAGRNAPDRKQGVRFPPGAPVQLSDCPTVHSALRSRIGNGLVTDCCDAGIDGRRRVIRSPEVPWLDGNAARISPGPARRNRHSDDNSYGSRISALARSLLFIPRRPLSSLYSAARHCNTSFTTASAP